ncbi:MAG TPA: hypothetical protein VG474_09730 [Solirubrobacteraceae bacterium]|nr:hypothetical protein [Solirubrobacteraceae bacterium]
MLAGLLVAQLVYVAFLRPGPVSGDLELVRSDRPGLRVLFVGNAQTSHNSMITMLRELAEGDPGAPRIFAVQYARRGSTLERAAREDRLEKLLANERWHYVVLQEHSQVASRPDGLAARTAPAAARLDALARAAGARTVLFVGWGYEDGDRDAPPGDTFAAMSGRLSSAHVQLGAMLGGLLAPVGPAWAAAAAEQPGIDLWAWDGIRPSRAGSYLTASVFYAVLTGRDPVRSRFAAGRDSGEARALRAIAARAVGRRGGLVATGRQAGSTEPAPAGSAG